LNGEKPQGDLGIMIASGNSAIDARFREIDHVERSSSTFTAFTQHAPN
jgi:hypothetical protein